MTSSLPTASRGKCPVKEKTGRIKSRFLWTICLYLVVFLGNFCFTWNWTMTAQHPEIRSSTGAVLSTPASLRIHNSLPIHRLLAENNASAEKPPFRIAAEEPIVQIISTRFMQNQPQLVDLGLARLELLKTICLPTLLAQTSQNFLWVLRVDPDLHESLQRPLLDLLEDAVSQVPAFKIVVVGSNENPDGFRQSQLQLDAKDVWTDNFQLLHDFHETAQSRIVLETRLDADDGLHRYFVETIQEDAKLHLGTSTKNNNNNWLVWCAGSHLEWQYGTPWADPESSPPTRTEVPDDYGSLLPGVNSACITAGLTKGYGPSVHFGDIPTANHNNLHHEMDLCDDVSEDGGVFQECLVHWKRLLPTAIRGRTPTSAGMQNVVVVGTPSSNDDNAETEDPKTKSPAELRRLQPIMWNAVQKHFRISQPSIARLRTYLTEHMAGLAQDNLKGQCTPGHSCKESSQKVLQEIAGVTL